MQNETPMAMDLPRPEYAESAAEAVAKIMACADIAVDSIGRQAEREVGEIWAEAEARPAREAMERRERLALLRAELAEQAAALALSYASILEQIGDVDRMLLGQQAEVGTEPGQELREADPRVAAIRMTLRERTRVHDPQAPQDQQAQEAPWVEREIGAPAPATTAADIWPPAEHQAHADAQAWPVEQQAQTFQYQQAPVQHQPPPVEQQAPAQQPAVELWHAPQEPEFAHLEPEEPRRRPWRLWKRAA
jgi:hypothetical protein